MQRLGLILRKTKVFRTDRGVPYDSDFDGKEYFYLTSLGYQLVLACQPPNARASES